MLGFVKDACAPSKAPISLAIVLPEDLSHSHMTGSPKIRHNGEVLEGFLDVSVSQQTEFKATVHFEGLSRTWIRQDHKGTENSTISTGEHKFLSQIQQIASSESEPEIRSGKYLYRVPFKFVIPKHLLSSSLNSLSLNLPPSCEVGLGCRNAFGHSFMQPLIRYTIRAVVVPKDAQVNSIDNERNCVSRDICLRPFRMASPPLEIADMPGDFRLSSTVALRKSTWGKNIGNIELSGVEPTPLNMLTDAPRSTSMVSLKLSFTPQIECAMTVRPFEWEFQVETKILVLTFYSTQPLEQEPGLEELKTKPFIRRDSSLINLETRIINDASWGTRRLSQHGTILPTDSSSWSTSFDVPINAPKDLLPTFLTPLASRRYALRVSVRVEGLHQPALKIQVPLQVNLEPPKSDVESPDGSEGNLLSDEEAIRFSGLELNETTASPPPYYR